jgi:hypothetical protein
MLREKSIGEKVAERYFVDGPAVQIKRDNLAALVNDIFANHLASGSNGVVSITREEFDRIMVIKNRKVYRLQDDFGPHSHTD